MQTSVKIKVFYTLFSSNVLVVQEKVIPLHPLSRTNETTSKARLVREKRANKERVL